MNKKTIIIGGFVVIFMVCLAFEVMQHERTHQKIAEYAGCINGSIHYGIDNYFLCHQYVNQTEDMYIAEYQLHSINEIVGYNLQSVMMFIFALIMLIMSTYIRIKEDD